MIALLLPACLKGGFFLACKMSAATLLLFSTTLFLVRDSVLEFADEAGPGCSSAELQLTSKWGRARTVRQNARTRDGALRQGTAPAHRDTKTPRSALCSANLRRRVLLNPYTKRYLTVDFQKIALDFEQSAAELSEVAASGPRSTIAGARAPMVIRARNSERRAGRSLNACWNYIPSPLIVNRWATKIPSHLGGDESRKRTGRGTPTLRDQLITYTRTTFAA